MNDTTTTDAPQQPASTVTGPSTTPTPISTNTVAHAVTMDSRTTLPPVKPPPPSSGDTQAPPASPTSSFMPDIASTDPTKTFDDGQPSPPKKSEKPWIFAGVGVLILLFIGGGILGATKLLGSKPQPSPTPVPKKRIVEPLNVIPQAERPYVLLSPESDGHNISLWVMSINKPANSVEYEMEYQAGELLQGVMGSLKLDSLPAKTTQLMGSCSAGGKCSYHENVRGGQLILHFIGENEARYGLKQEWKYIDNKAKETAFSSKDGMFQLTSPNLKTHRYIVIYNSPGAPASGTLASEVYSLQTSSPLKGKGELTLRATEEKPNLAIAGYDGKEWKVFKSTTDGKMVTATVDLMPTYVVTVPTAE